MNCQQIDKYIYEYCDKRLSLHMQDSIQSHLEQCESCREKAAEAESESHVLRSMEPVAVLGPEFTGRVLAMVQQKHGPAAAGMLAAHPSRYHRQFRWWWGIASAAVFLLAIYSLPLLKLPLGTQLAEHNAADMQTQTLPAVVDNDVQNQTTATQAPQPAAPERSDQLPPQQTGHDSATTIASRENTALRNTASPVPAAQPFSIAALPDQASKTPSRENPNRGVELLTLHPANLPPEYALRAVISTSDQDITFVYLNQLTQEELKLRLTMVQEQSVSTEAAGAAEGLRLKSAAPLNPEGSKEMIPESGLLTNSYQARMDLNRQTYQLEVSGNLETRDLAAIANSITLEEGTQGVKTENPEGRPVGTDVPVDDDPDRAGPER